MRVNCVLHTFSAATPGGGLKVQYEYANRLAARGHDVVVYHNLNFRPRALPRPRSVAGAVRANLAGPGAVKWFRLSVRARYIPQILPPLLRPADVTLVDSFLVTERLAAGGRTGAMVHLVYEYPVWCTGGEALRARLVRSLRRPDITRIATSTAVEDMLTQCGSQATAKITCGIELPDLAAIPPTAERAPSVGFALRSESHKGVVDMLAALPSIRAACPHVRFEAFGSHAGFELPDDVCRHGYLDEAALQDFYKRISVFVSPSHAEGWGLTAAEAMANGAALVVAQNGGAADFARNQKTALVVPANAPEALAAAAIELLRDEALRGRIVAGGISRSRDMSWERSVLALERLIVELVALPCV